MSRSSARVPRMRREVEEISAIIASLRGRPADEQAHVLAEVIRIAAAHLVRLSLGAPSGR